MDWINQNKFKSLLIGLLLVLNILTLGTIWMQTMRNDAPRPAERNDRPTEQAGLMNEALKFTDRQARQYDTLRTQQREQTKQYNDRLAELKAQLAADVFADKPDTAAARAKAKAIGELQAIVELARYNHFRALVAICTPAQREDLRPVVAQVFGRKPPREEAVGRNQQPGEKRDRPEQPGKRAEQDKRERADAPPRDQHNGRTPPSLEEKLSKYTERLALTADQIPKVRAVLAAAQEKSEQLRMKQHPDRAEMETLKARIRKEEDAGIMNILSAEQKPEFERMAARRKQ